MPTVKVIRIIIKLIFDFICFLVIYLDADIFLFGKKLESLETAFAPDARLLHPAERRSQINREFRNLKANLFLQ